MEINEYKNERIGLLLQMSFIPSIAWEANDRRLIKPEKVSDKPSEMEQESEFKVKVAI